MKATKAVLASRTGCLGDVGLDLAGSCGAALILTIFRTPRVSSRIRERRQNIAALPLNYFREIYMLTY